MTKIQGWATAGNLDRWIIPAAHRATVASLFTASLLALECLKNNRLRGTMARIIKLGSRSFELPNWAPARIAIGILLIIFGVLGFLPVVGFTK